MNKKSSKLSVALIVAVLASAAAGLLLAADPVALSSLVAASSLNDADLVYVVQSGTSKKGTVAQIRSGRVPESRTLAATAPIKIGGGSSADLSSNRTLSIDDASTSQKGAIQIGGQLGGSATSQDVRGLRETGGPTLLTLGAIADGQNLIRSGTSIVGSSSLSGEYSPDAAPTSGTDSGATDEFTSSINTGIATWANQGTATRTAEAGSMRVHTAAASGNDLKMQWYSAPSGVDFVVVAKIGFAMPSSDETSYWHDSVFPALAILESGSIGTPTSFSEVVAYWSGGLANLNFGFFSGTTYTGSLSGVGSLITWGSGQNADTIAGRPFWLMIRYAASTKVLTAMFSLEGISWRRVGSTRTLSAHPTQIGLAVDQNGANADSDFRFYYLRTFTSGGGISYPYLVGR